MSAEPRTGDGLDLLLNVIDAMTLEPEFERFFARAADAVRELVGADGAALIRLNADGVCEYQFFQGAPAEHLNGFEGYRFSAATGVTGAALRERRSIFVEDYPANDRAMPEFVDAGMRSSLVMPLLGCHGPVGALAMSWFRLPGTVPDARCLALAERVASQIAVAFERRQLEQRLAHLASEDALTGVANRTRILEALEGRLAGAPHARPFAVALVDLDGFKAINDACGHATGDRMLRDVGNRVREICRASDDIGRLGGDEFVVISDLDGGGRSVTPLLRRLNAAVNIQTSIGPRIHRLSASIGVACFPEDGDSAESLLRRADLAMYQAKREGGNRFQFFARSMEEDLHARQLLLDEIQLAVLNDDFALHYQPIMRMDEPRVVAFEALLRWNHRREGLLSAGKFITVVEQHGRGLVRQIGRWVLHTAARQLNDWQSKGRTVAVHANVSACYFLERSFTRDLEQVLSASPGIDPGGLVLELTETALVDDLDRAAEVMEECRALGVRLALDDFGTGFASLTYLKRLPVDTVKIDHSFIKDLCEQPNDRGIVRGILAMAHALNLSVVAEGVEMDAQVKALLELGCHQMQGYGLGLPAAAGPELESRMS